MKHIKLYEGWFNRKKDNKKLYPEVANLCDKYGIINYKILDDGSIDVNYNVSLHYKNDLVKHDPISGKIPIKFNNVGGYFECNGLNLITLENFPRYVGQDFICSQNNLTTLLGGPSHVVGNYRCIENNLKDLYGFPEFFEGYFNIYGIVDYRTSQSYLYNPVYEIIKLVPFSKTNSFIRIMNDFQVIRNQDTVIESRLIDAMCEVGWGNKNRGTDKYEDPKFEFKHYKLI